MSIDTEPRPLQRHHPLLLLSALLLLGCVLACASVAPVALAACPELGTTPEIPDAELDVTIFLIGDTGEADDEILEAFGEALRGRAARVPEAPSYAVFLGDNVYPDGLPPRAQGFQARRARARLDAQLELFRSSDGTPTSEPPAFGIFVPGNHDWDNSGRYGLERVLRQEEYIASLSGGGAALFPGGGCPGPEVRYVGERLQLIALDTQWWLQDDDYEKPRDPSSDCREDSRSEVVESLQRWLGSAGTRRSLVVAHHPLASGGDHGRPGCTSFDDQDIDCDKYQDLREALLGAFRDAPPVLYATGHDHDLQLLRLPGVPTLQAISGSGSKLESVDAKPETLFCKKAPGWMRLDVAKGGRVRLEVVEARRGRGRVLGSRELAPNYALPVLPGTQDGDPGAAAGESGGGND